MNLLDKAIKELKEELDIIKPPSIKDM